MTDNSIAEIIGNDKAEEELRKRALDELVDTIMDGEKYPKHGHYICLHDILSDLDSVDLSELIHNCLFSKAPIIGYCDLRDTVEELAKKRLDDSVWHHRMIEQLAEEDRD